MSFTGHTLTQRLQVPAFRLTWNQPIRRIKARNTPMGAEVFTKEPIEEERTDKADGEHEQADSKLREQLLRKEMVVRRPGVVGPDEELSRDCRSGDRSRQGRVLEVSGRLVHRFRNHESTAEDPPPQPGEDLQAHTLKFDKKGSTLAEIYLKKTAKQDRIGVEVTGTMKGDTIRVKTLSEAMM